ncbi:hypothetical protein GWI33_013573 [Rhynchophorus ferrugineus]|uniref:Uncharacterized protein n=1 Tax=Rhynchophorus ferrugineus TaxID=354439 RepID=A0A834M6I2_RHYFE|nr:hypothetical protein GWI33_013573 [Rhynchophorus ferrugineus]
MAKGGSFWEGPDQNRYECIRYRSSRPVGIFLADMATCPRPSHASCAYSTLREICRMGPKWSSSSHSVDSDRLIMETSVPATGLVPSRHRRRLIGVTIRPWRRYPVDLTRFPY